jgi:hypothetical protein
VAAIQPIAEAGGGIGGIKDRPLDKELGLHGLSHLRAGVVAGFALI